VDTAAFDSQQITVATDPLLWQVDRFLSRGEARRARAALQAAVTQSTASRQHLIRAARLELDLDCAPAAFALLQRAAALSVDVDVGLMLDECCARLARDESRASLWEMAARVCRRSGRDGRSEGPATRSTMRIATDSTPGSDTFRQAVLLRDCLAVTADAGIVLPGQEHDATREDGVTLILIEPDGRWEQLARRLRPRRIVVRLPRDDPEALLRCLTRLEETWPDAALQFTRPHAAAGGDSDPRTPVEYPWIDPAMFMLDPPSRERPVIGRAGPPLPGDDHPDDGEFYRNLNAKGWKVQIPHTQFLNAAFAEDATRPILTRENDTVANLEALDIVVLRGSPTRRGSADARVIAAMAAARPVVVFAHALGAREWIANGETGFVVETEDEARQWIAQLAASSRLRAKIGIAARRIAVVAMDEQRSRARAFYLGVSLNE
jgi:hypothetical protein